MVRWVAPAAQVGAAVLGTWAVHLLLSPGGAPTPGVLAQQLVRASGVSALVWAYLGLVVGLLAGSGGSGVSRLLPVSRAGVVTLHRQLNLTALALTVLHLAAFVVAPGGSLLVALVPQTAQVGAFGYTLGVIGFYLMVLLGPSWYLRDRIGRWAWLVAHQGAAVSYAAGLWHTLLLGGDVRVEGVVRTVFWVAQVPLLALLLLRVCRPRRPAERLAIGGRPGGAATGRPVARRPVALRVAVYTGVGTAAFVVFFVLLAALGEGRAEG